MVTEVEDLYRQVGQYIFQTIPESWTEAWIAVEFEPGVVSAQGYYIASETSDERSFQVTGDVNRLFISLRQLVQKDKQHMFKGAKFMLKADGEFRIDFEY
jgi:hypothetical protein